jgi:hypothetical protein
MVFYSSLDNQFLVFVKDKKFPERNWVEEGGGE